MLLLQVCYLLIIVMLLCLIEHSSQANPHLHQLDLMALNFEDKSSKPKGERGNLVCQCKCHSRLCCNHHEKNWAHCLTKRIQPFDSQIHARYLRCKRGKVDQKMLQYTKTTNFLVKGLKVVAKYYLNWFFLMMTSIDMLNTLDNVDYQVEIFNI